MPLDFGAVNTCKELAKRQLEKERLDYELVRIKECIGIYQAGFTIDPRSPFFSFARRDSFSLKRAQVTGGGFFRIAASFFRANLNTGFSIGCNCLNRVVANSVPLTATTDDTPAVVAAVTRISP